MTALKRVRTSIAGLVLAWGLVSPATAAVTSYDLTGTWVGVVKCKSSLGGVTSKTTLTPTMQVTQVGLDVGMQFTVGNELRTYVGRADPDAKKPEQKGELVALFCGTDGVVGDGRDEIARLTVATKPGKAKATIKGLTVFANPGEQPGEAGYCSWKWTRADTTDASVPTACPSSLVSRPSTARAALGAREPSDLTGTWIGKFKCKGFETGVKIRFPFAPTIRISQSGLRIGMSVDYGTGDVDRYGGLMIPDGKKPLAKAQVAVGYCDTNSVLADDFDELGILVTTTKPPGVRASLKGTTLYSEGVADPEAGTCKWSYKRTSTADPSVPVTCAPGATARR